MHEQYLETKFLYKADAGVVAPLKLLAFKPPTNFCIADPFKTDGSLHTAVIPAQLSRGWKEKTAWGMKR